MKIIAASIMALSMTAASPQDVSLTLVSPQQQTAIGYRFDEVRRSVTLMTPSKQLSPQAGTRAQSGDRVQTGWFSYALIASEQHRAKFEIFSSTTVQLAGGTPGVILSLERGRLRAMFDKITGTEPRIVKTPGALLAVRGTAYDVSVDDDGQATLEVTEGTVEVRSDLRPEPLFVKAGEMCRYGRQQAPVARPRGEMMPRGNEPRGNEPRGGERGGEGRGNEPGRGMQPPNSGKGMPGGQPPMTPPTPPPTRGH